MNGREPDSRMDFVSVKWQSQIYEPSEPAKLLATVDRIGHGSIPSSASEQFHRNFAVWKRVEK